jgi:prevent-host-death family protein
MKKLNIRQARQSLGNLDGLLAQEGELTITRRGEEIARVMPISQKRPMPSHSALRRSIPRMRKSSEKMIREDRDRR